MSKGNLISKSKLQMSNKIQKSNVKVITIPAFIYYWVHKTVCICIQYMIPSKSGVLKQGYQFYRETNFQHISIGEKFIPINPS